MLTKFAVTNFRGFPERIEWDLSNPNNYSYNENAIKDGVIKNGIIYGPNGSGKTNFSLAIFDIENHLSQKWKKPDYYNNFIYAGNLHGSVDFEYTFKFDNQIVNYLYSKNRAGSLIKERLDVDGKQVFSKEQDSFVIDSDMFSIDKGTRNNLKNNANNVSIINYLLSSYPLDKDNYLLKLQRFVNNMLWFRNLDVREFIGFETNVVDLDEYIITNKLLDDFSAFLTKVSGQSFKLVEEQSSFKKQIICKIDKTLIPFQLIASTGTKSLQLLYFWIRRIADDASFVFIDEFDAFYHFRLSFEVCKYLFSLNSQVFTSSHNTYLMTNDLLRPDCNFILCDNKIKSLKDCTDKELRFGHNIEKLFRGNAFHV